MKTRYFFAGITIILLTYNSCATKNDIPDTKLINEILIETIKQDSLDTSLPLSNKLINYFIYTIKIERNSDIEFPPPPPPPPSNKIGEPLTLHYFRLNMEKLIGYRISDEDSLFFERQISNFKNIELDSIKFKDIIRVEDNIHRRLDKYRSREVYEFLIPLFNHDKTIVWVEYNHRCPACGHGRMVIFRKINNSWSTIDSYTTWRN